MGRIVIGLFGSTSPKTVRNFVGLANHEVIKIYLYKAAIIMSKSCLEREYLGMWQKLPCTIKIMLSKNCVHDQVRMPYLKIVTVCDSGHTLLLIPCYKVILSLIYGSHMAKRPELSSEDYARNSIQIGIDGRDPKNRPKYKLMHLLLWHFFQASPEVGSLYTFPWTPDIKALSACLILGVYVLTSFFGCRKGMDTKEQFFTE